MELIYKQDIEDALARINAWWAGSAIDRPALQVYAAKPDFQRGAPERPTDIHERWTNAEYVVQKGAAAISSLYYGGEALPFFRVDLGPVCIPAFLGGQWILDETTGWCRPTINDWEDYEPPRFDPDNQWWQTARAITKRALEEGEGKFLVAMIDLGSGGDELVQMRGSQNMCLDLMLNPDRVKAALHDYKGFLAEYYDQLYDLMVPKQHGASIGWMGVYSPKKMYTLQCDFSCMISPKMFQEFFLPVVQEQARHFDHVIYHLDGPGAVQHLDALLEVPELDAIQWVPGAGADPMPAWIPLLKRIQEGRKGLHISVQADEVEELVRNLSAEGLMVQTICLGGEEQARQLLKDVHRWTVGKK